MAALRGETRLVATARPGTRNDTLNRAAFNLGRACRHAADCSRRWPSSSTLASAAERAGLPEDESLRTIRSGNDGRKQEAPAPAAPGWLGPAWRMPDGHCQLRLPSLRFSRGKFSIHARAPCAATSRTEPSRLTAYMMRPSRSNASEPRNVRSTSA